MGTSCKKPTRVNTSRAIAFVRYFLDRVHTDMDLVVNDPLALSGLNARVQADESMLVRRYEYDASHRNVKVYLSSYELRRRFGAAAETIWRKLFVRLNKGGWSPVKRQAYDSCWVLNQDAERRFQFAKQRYVSAGGISPAQLLQALESFDEKVVAPTEYVADVDPELGFKAICGCAKKVMTRDRHRAVLRDSQGLRVAIREHNLRLHFESLAQGSSMLSPRLELNLHE